MKRQQQASLILLMALLLEGTGCGEYSVEFRRERVDAGAIAEKLASSEDAAVIEALSQYWQVEEVLPKGLPRFVELLDHKDPEIRQLASYNLFRMGAEAKSAVDSVKKALESEWDVNARLQHEKTLESISSQDSDVDQL